MSELIVKKCYKCGQVIKVINNTNRNILCCGDEMKVLVPNTFEASFEKHIPTYEIKDGVIYAKVDHVMEDNHYIEWICFVSPDEVSTTYFKPHDIPEAHFKNIKGTTIYAYCNKHELWKIEVK